MPKRLASLAIFGMLLCSTALAQPSGKVSTKLRALSQSELDRSVEAANPARGAVLFHGPVLACGRCHSVVETGPALLGPNLVMPLKNGSPTHVLASILDPSKDIAEQYRATQILTEDGETLTGLLVDETADAIQLKKADTQQVVSVNLSDVVDRKTADTSLMPSGLLDTLPNVQAAMDLLAYVAEIQAGGFKRASELQPTAAQLAIQLPEYESNIDHAGIIGEWDDDAFDRGKAVYESLCINCHGTKQKQGSLATALRFGEGKFKFGDDPFSMYQTMTRGGGLMAPQPWMVPQQKYDVIHYIREHFLEDTAAEIDETYLAGLPTGSDRGPAPREFHPWSTADYGPRLIGTYEIGAGGRNIAQKGIAVQLDASPGGVSQGRAWAVFDHDTMRLAGVWTSREFIDWQGIHFNGRHNIHPSIVGDILINNPTGPGWAEPGVGTTADEQRVLGRDGKRYGPLPRTWAQYKGLRQIGGRSIIEYTVGDTLVSEEFSWSPDSDLLGTEFDPAKEHSGLFTRNLQIGPRSQSLQVVVATLADGQHWNIDGLLAVPNRVEDTIEFEHGHFSGSSFYEGTLPKHWDTTRGFTFRAKLTTKGDGTIFSLAPASGQWAPGGQTLFVQGGRLTYDVGWVGQLRGNIRIDDGQPHDVALTLHPKTQLAKLYVDGTLVGKKRLPIEELPERRVIRFGKTNDDFPSTSFLQDAVVERAECVAEAIDDSEIADWTIQRNVLASWDFTNGDTQVADSGQVKLLRGDGQQVPDITPAIWIDQSAQTHQFALEARDEQLLLSIPPGERIAVAVCAADSRSSFVGQATDTAPAVEAVVGGNVSASSGGTSPSRRASPPLPFTEPLKTIVVQGVDYGEGFAVDTIPLPVQNPWQARLRLGGIDFYEGGDSAAICTWDGDVWVVDGLSNLDKPGSELVWQRVAFGLFQPLGIKIIEGEIYLTCRDQLVKLEDEDGDRFVDYYRCINNDHQVTEHFHEFAMGLQTDDAGNFYYAKSARHALPALVPHHGTLLKVSADGQTTEILANGFRAANGVCLNPDGSFIVTDQEGHWNPKNRINWVQPGGFYGNMYGYHDTTDSSDSAMEQPLCWITNAFDRSPAELLWTESNRWGPFDRSLLNLSYGYGKVFVVPHQQIRSNPESANETRASVQGGMCQLPIPDFPTGLIRGRFSPADGQLYVCGLAAWATSQTAQEGGLYRIRYTGEPAAMPLGLEVDGTEISIRLSEKLPPTSSVDPSLFSVRVWSLKRTKNYGSKHYDERTLEVRSATLLEDGQTVVLSVPELEPTWCMEIVFNVTTQEGRQVRRVIHNTVHKQ